MTLLTQKKRQSIVESSVTLPIFRYQVARFFPGSFTNPARCISQIVGNKGGFASRHDQLRVGTASATGFPRTVAAYAEEPRPPVAE
jgi:hypothetical protein